MDAQLKKSLYESMLARDPRNDGRFFVGVKTTGIYCRPICPAKPQLENVEFYRSKAEAENAGFRPCLRCRPDASPLSFRWQGTAAVMGRALKILEEVDQRGGEIDEVADRLGFTDRHLRRLFQEHLGASPIQVAISQRLHLARQLLAESSLSILEIALASGFHSLRRFNDAFLKAYQKQPSDFRKENSSTLPLGTLNISLPYLPPFDWDNFIAFFKRHQAIGIECIEDNLYVRHFQSRHGFNSYSLCNNSKMNRMELTLQLSSLEDLRSTIEKIRSQFDLAHNPFHLAVPNLKSSEALQDTLSEVRSMRIPGAFDPFETAVSIVLSQLVSTERARDLLKVIIERMGQKLAKSSHEQLTHIFPSPRILRDADFSGVGLTKARAEAIKGLAKEVDEGRLVLSAGSDLEETRNRLLAIKGIGPWTVELICMRCLSDPDAFPAKDLIVQRALEKFDLGPTFYSPWRAYFALAIWKTQAHLLSKKGTSK